MNINGLFQNETIQNSGVFGAYTPKTFAVMVFDTVDGKLLAKYRYISKEIQEVLKTGKVRDVSKFGLFLFAVLLLLIFF